MPWFSFVPGIFFDSDGLVLNSFLHACGVLSLKIHLTFYLLCRENTRLGHFEYRPVKTEKYKINLYKYILVKSITEFGGFLAPTRNCL